MSSRLPTATGVSLLKYPTGDEPFSIARLMYAAYMRKIRGDVHAFSTFAPREKKYLDAANAATDGATLDDYIAGRTKPHIKAQSIGTGQDGGFLAPEEFGLQFFGILRSFSILDRAGATFLPVDARLGHNARMTADFTENYSTDNQTLTASQASFAQSTFTPRKQSVIVTLGRELVRDSAPAADQIIMNQGAEFMARRRDYQSLFGTGTAGTPTGLINMTNVTTTSLGANGATPTWANLQTGVANVRALNGSTNVPVGQADCSAVIAATRLAQTMYAMTDTTNVRPYFLAGGIQGALDVPQWIFSNTVPINVTQGSSSDASYILYGAWQNLVVRYRSDIEFALATELADAFTNDEIKIRLIHRYDVAAVHPEAFFVHSGVRG